MSDKPAILVLADGTVYEGLSLGATGSSVGELVFNTSMTGYQEILTDPSYARQMVTLTAAHVGNTGCNSEDLESSKVWAAGLVIRNSSIYHSNYRTEQSLSDWLRRQGVVAISGVDTRDLTLRLREQGTLGACITTKVQEKDQALEQARSFSDLQGMDLAFEVSRQAIERWHEGQGIWGEPSKPNQFHVVAYDFGIKHNILRLLHDKGCYITIVPAKTPASEVLAINPKGVLLSNGPGDPKACDYAIKATQEFLDHNMPLFGICLGFQILALACGAVTKKMKFGHHGANHPVVEIQGKKRVFLSSQNHNFAVDEASLPDSLEVSHRSLFDGSLQGIVHKTKPAFGFQGHPEASPGPHDLEGLFDQFITLMK